jgi:hypothetical protein
MRLGFISVEKSKYTALLRRVLGLHVSENGVSEIEAILTTISSIADGARRSYNYGVTKQEIDDNIESIELAIEYYRICQLDAVQQPVVEAESNSPAF